MGNSKTISVIMSTYNERDEYIQEAIESVRKQTYNNWELIIVVDAPDNSHLIKLIDDYVRIDNRIKKITNSTNIGLALSLNEALNHCTGDYVARMDADDVCIEERFEKQVKFLDKNVSYDLVCTGRYNIDEDGKDIDVHLLSPKDDYCLMKSLSYGSLITHPSVMIRRDAIINAGGYNNYPSGQDYDLWLRLRKAGCKFHYMSEPLLKYRIRKTSISKSKMGLQVICGHYARILDKKGLSFNEKDFKSFVEMTSKDDSFKCFISFKERVDSKNKVSVWNYIYLLLSNRYFREMINNSLNVRRYTK